MSWHSKVWFCVFFMVQFGLVCYGTVIVQFDTVGGMVGISWYSLVWYSLVWRSQVGFGYIMVEFGTV